MTTEAEMLSATHAVLRDSRNACTDPERRDHLERLRRWAWDRVLSAQRQSTMPLVFDIRTPGFVTLGVGADVQTFEHPGLQGINDLAAIFAAGPTVSSTLHAVDLVGNVRRPGNALRNRLSRAAQWIEYVADCRELACYVQSISARDNGQIAIARNRAVVLAPW